ncbi:hypothetical protein BRADI_1g14800v3 [Brachypodium distachyon]|uniref:Dirigent protein n=1 Tax=Brachypodium distachyon TaxID=15368 RepID=I1GQC2_BRADI|nr:hypothetical protein BRADI_1g14800v3 [Brachypodium distachyon]
MAAASVPSSRSLATTCLLALLLTGWMAVADARRLLDTHTAMPMPPAASPGLAPAPESGADYYGGRMLFEGRGLLAGGFRLAGRLLLGVGF